MQEGHTYREINQKESRKGKYHYHNGNKCSLDLANLNVLLYFIQKIIVHQF